MTPSDEYRRQSLIDRALGKLACVATGHRWWWMIDHYRCGQCGARRDGTAPDAAGKQAGEAWRDAPRDGRGQPRG
jgi:hypothetical protein